MGAGGRSLPEEVRDVGAVTGRVSHRGNSLHGGSEQEATEHAQRID